MIVLGIETSCDETAAAVVNGDRREILSNVVLSQLDEHRAYGGVVPEIASRAHVQHLDGVIDRAMREADTRYADLSGIAATAGPGLIGGVMVGLVTGKAIAASTGRPLVAVNHLEGHALSARLTDGIEFPYLLLLVSGGHCQLVEVAGVGTYRRLGTTYRRCRRRGVRQDREDAGPRVPGRTRGGTRGPRGRPRAIRPSETAARPARLRLLVLGTEDRRAPRRRRPDGRGSEGEGCRRSGRVVPDRRGRRPRRPHRKCPENVRGAARARRPPRGGGRCRGERLPARAHGSGVRRITDFSMSAPPPELCTDNAAMIAWAGLERLRFGLTDPLDAPARARWPLDEVRPPACRRPAGSMNTDGEDSP